MQTSIWPHSKHVCLSVCSTHTSDTRLRYNIRSGHLIRLMLLLLFVAVVVASIGIPPSIESRRGGRERERERERERGAKTAFQSREGPIGGGDGQDGRREGVCVIRLQVQTTNMVYWVFKKLSQSLVQVMRPLCFLLQMSPFHCRISVVAPISQSTFRRTRTCSTTDYTAYAGNGQPCLTRGTPLRCCCCCCRVDAANKNMN